MVTPLDLFSALPAGALAAALAATVGYAARLRRRLLTDPATGLANRDALARAVTRTRRAAVCVGLLLLDLDEFKQINDRHGHETGNHVIRVIADRLREVARPAELAVRLHGDEFVLLLGALPSGPAGRRVARLRADAVAAVIADPIPTPRGDLVVTGSVGAAVLPADLTVLSALLSVADDAMYAAKYTRIDRTRPTVEVA